VTGTSEVSLAVSVEGLDVIGPTLSFVIRSDIEEQPRGVSFPQLDGVCVHSADNSTARNPAAPLSFGRDNVEKVLDVTASIAVGTRTAHAPKRVDTEVKGLS
jgi:hypothetical protein